MDDDSFMRKTLEICLNSPLYTLTTCSNAIDAMIKFEQNKYDLLIFDILMPGITGLELRNLVRAKSKNIPIILLTAKVDDSQGSLLREITSDRNTYYQNKNFKKSDLIILINHIMAMVQYERERENYYSEIENDISQAGTIQRAIIPNWVSLNYNIFSERFYRPYMEITGDVFNTFKLSSKSYLIIIGDISGHGIQSALCMTAVYNAIVDFLWNSSLEDIQPHEVLNRMQRFFDDIDTLHYMTCLVAILNLETNQFSYQSAGHPDFIFYSFSQGFFSSSNSKVGNLPVGMIPKTTYSAKDNVILTLPKDSIIYGYTDGLTDLQNENGESFSIKLLKDAISSSDKRGGCYNSLYRVMDLIFKTGYQRITDDITLISILPVHPNECTIVSNSYAFTETSAIYIVPPQLLEIDSFATSAYNWILAKTNSEQLGFKAQLLLSEFLNNIVIHGLNSIEGRSPVILICLQLSSVSQQKQLFIRIFDKGVSWDLSFENTSNKDVDILNEHHVDHGRGIFLIKNLADGVSRTRLADELNETIFNIYYDNPETDH